MLAQTSMRSVRVPMGAPLAIVAPLRPMAPARMLSVSANSAAGQSKLYVGNLSFDTTKDDLFQLFGKYGEVTDVFIPEDRESGRPRGFGFVTIATEAVQTAVSELDGTSLLGRDLRVNEAQARDASAPRERTERAYGSERSFSSERPERAPRPPLDPSQAKLYVGNLAWETSKEDLTDLFSKYGTVHDVNLPSDRETGRPRGFGFVTVDRSGVSEIVREMEGFEFMGRTLRVNEAQDEVPGGGGGGFRGGRGGGRGGGGFRGGRGGDGFRGGRGGGGGDRYGGGGRDRY